jgi:streptogrisin B
VDVAAGTVRVTVDDTVTAAEVAAIRREAGDLAGALAFDRTPGRLTPRVQGGESVWASGGSRCTLAFNVAAGATAYFLTAGHCLTGHPTWYTTQALTTVIGPTAGVSFPGNDYGIVRYANTAVPRPGTVLCNGQVVDITGWTVPIVGTTVWMAGATTGCHSGTITGLNHTVNWGGGSIVSGLIATNVCAEPGDSGAPLFTRSGSTGLAVGILSGGSGNCASGGTTYWQPIGEVLSAYGVGLL